MRTFRLTDEFATYFDAAPADALVAPSMMMPKERHFLYNLASRYYRGEGEIFDLGIFLGGSTTSLGEGLRANPRRDEILARWPKPIRSFELARFHPAWRKLFEKHGLPTDLEPGESFAHHTERLIASVADLIDLRIGDVIETGVPDGPIEIMFIDLMKTPEVADFQVRRQFPALIPGHSIVMEQDYFVPELPFILVAHEYFADRFDYLGEAASSAMFRLAKPITEAEVADFSLAAISPERQVELATMSLERTRDPNRIYMLEMALAYLRLVHYGQEAARAHLAEVDAGVKGAAEVAKYARLRSARELLDRTIDEADAHEGWQRLWWLR